MTRTRIVALAIVAVLVIGGAFALWSIFSSDDPEPVAAGLDLALADATTAEDPWTGLTETRLSVGGDCLRVLIADEEDERAQGLRRVDDLDPYAGMLFVFETPIDARFTMSTVPVALSIGFYEADGTAVSRERMAPCADSELECPVYRAGAPFSFALETPGGELPHGPIAGCS